MDTTTKDTVCVNDSCIFRHNCWTWTGMVNSRDNNVEPKTPEDPYKCVYSNMRGS